MSAFETLVRYQTQTSGQIGLELFPPDKPRPSINTDSLAHAKCVADPYPGGFAHGHTMRDAHTFRLERREGAVTTLRNRAGHRIEHQLTPRGRTFEVRTTFFNDAREPVTLEMLTSFSLGGISGQLRVHRSRSGWSAEGRHELQTIDNCTWKNPGPAWARSASASDKSEHCRSEWFPFVAIEDVASGITWGHSWPGQALGSWRSTAGVTICASRADLPIANSVIGLVAWSQGRRSRHPLRSWLVSVEQSRTRVTPSHRRKR
jgi:hypothetical protein